MAKKINYYARNFADVRTELVNFVRQYYPDILNDFNDASVGMMLIELNAAVADMLSYHTDRMFQETQIDFAQERKSILSMARTFGLKIPGKRPSITICDFSVTLPVDGDTFDLAYAPFVTRGAQVTGGGKVFETVDDIDFSSPFTTGGIPNRIIIPNRDSNGNIVNYTITKREIVLNGITKTFKRVINDTDVKPFLEIVLPDNDILSVESVILLEGTNYVNNPPATKFYDPQLRWYEVDALAEDKVFIEDKNKLSDNSGVVAGRWERVDRRFITEYTDNGFLKLIFGAGTTNTDSLTDFDTNPALVNQIGDFINNLSLGSIPSANRTMFIQYRVGGGVTSNIGSNTINSISIADVRIDGPDTSINQAVQKSFTVNNPVPALGGRDEPSVEEIRNIVRYNFASQNRAVTIKDYVARLSLMDGKFGVPFRCGVYESQNKIVISIIGQDGAGNLSNLSTNTIRENIATYLSEYRMINDYIEVENGRVINLAFEVDLYIDKQFPQSQIISQVINEVANYMDIRTKQMGENIYLAQLIENINNVSGVLNVIDLRVFNKVGQGKYSNNEISQPYINENTRQIDLLGEFTIFGEPNAMYEIRFPQTDILVRVK